VNKQSSRAGGPMAECVGVRGYNGFHWVLYRMQLTEFYCSSAGERVRCDGVKAVV
jgi:hypothetical protein